MNAKILFASFVVVFLAELGDKTQLTALAFSSQSRSPWSVFIGTSLALVASSALAVLLGDFLSRVFPEKVMHIASGVMFVLIGLLLLVNVARKAPVTPVEQGTAPEATEEASAGPTPVTGLVSAVILRQAIHFEQDLIASLREQVGRLEPGTVREGVEAMIAEDEAHLSCLSAMAQGGELGSDGNEADAHAPVCGLPHQMTEVELDALLANIRPPQSADPASLLRECIRREEGAATFYLSLARLTHLHDARDTFRWLAMEEIRHAQDLCELVNHIGESSSPTAAQA